MTQAPSSGSPAGPEGADPSMEEILASIRRILNEEEMPPTSEATAPEETPAEDDVLLLDQSMLVAAPEPEVAATLPATLAAPPEPGGGDPSVHNTASPVSSVEPLPPIPPLMSAPAPPPPDDRTLLAPETAAAAALSVDGLLRSLAASRTAQVYRGGPTIEDVVREEVRPLLKVWLDTNLPPLVERLVRAEIERLVARAVP